MSTGPGALQDQTLMIGYELKTWEDMNHDAE